MAASPPRLESAPAPAAPAFVHAVGIRRSLLLVAAFVIALAVLGEGITAPFIKDAEPQSAQWVADIVRHDHWLLAYDYYHIANPKPPLFYWLSALVTEASGGQVDPLRTRAVSLIAGAVLATEVMAWSAARLGPAGGWLAYVFLLGSYGFASRATTALTDMLMTLWLFSAYLVLMPQIEGVASWWRTVAAGTLLGLAILTKGPVTLVLMGLAVLLFMLLRGRNPLRLLSCGWPWAVAGLSLLLAAGWYIPALAVNPHLSRVILAENFGHFMPAGAGGTGEAARPFYYIAMRLVGGALPLTLLLPTLILGLAAGSFASAARRPLLYQLAMALAVLILFSAASAKRDDYILPALPPLAILFAALFAALDPCASFSGHIGRLRDFTVGVVAIVLALGTVAAFCWFRSGYGIAIMARSLNSSDKSYTAIFSNGLAQLAPSFAIFGAAVLAGAGISCAGIWRGRPMLSGAGLGLLCLAGSTLWTGTLRPREASTRSVAGFAARVEAEVGSGALYLAYEDPEFSWYYGRGVPALPRRLAIEGPPTGLTVYFVGRPRDLAAIAPRVRRHMRATMKSDVLGGGGPPALYLFGS